MLLCPWDSPEQDSSHWNSLTYAQVKTDLVQAANGLVILIEPSNCINNFLEKPLDSPTYTQVMSDRLKQSLGFQTLICCFWLVGFPGLGCFRHTPSCAHWQSSVLFLITFSFSPSQRVECHRTKSLICKNIQRVQIYLFFISCQGKNAPLCHQDKVDSLKELFSIRLLCSGYQGFPGSGYWPRPARK